MAHMRYGIVVDGNPEDGISGDAVVQEDVGGLVLLGGVDGLGHGPQARVPALRAVATVRENKTHPLDTIFTMCDHALEGTRGAAMSLVLVDPARESLTYAGIGNVTIHVVGEERRRLRTLPGIIGGGLGKVTVESTHFTQGDTLIIHSDGISDRFDLDRYTRRVLSDVQLLAEALARDYRNPRDDASILIAR